MAEVYGCLEEMMNVGPGLFGPITMGYWIVPSNDKRDSL